GPLPPHRAGSAGSKPRSSITDGLLGIGHGRHPANHLRSVTRVYNRRVSQASPGDTMIPSPGPAEASRQRPCLRPLEVLPTEIDGQQMYCLRDHLEPEAALLVSRAAVLLLSLMDGERDLGQLSAAFELRTGQALPPEEIEGYVRQLDEVYLLEGG